MRKFIYIATDSESDYLNAYGLKKSAISIEFQRLIDDDKSPGKLYTERGNTCIGYSGGHVEIHKKEIYGKRKLF